MVMIRAIYIVLILISVTSCTSGHDALLKSAMEDATYGDTDQALQKIKNAIYAGADPNYFYDGTRIAEIVIENARLDLLKTMIDQGLNVKTHDFDKDGELDQSLLNSAIYVCNSEETDLCTPMLEAGADPNGHEDFELPILLAAENKNFFAVKLLLKHGARLKYEDYDSVLLIAAGKGALDIVKFLLEQGEQPEDNNQFMLYAVSSNNPALVDYLLPHYKNDVIPDELYATAAMKLAYAESEDETQQAKSILALLRKRNIPESGQAYDDALIIAALERSLNKIDYFVQHGADFRRKSEVSTSLLAHLLSEDDLNRVFLNMNPLSKRYKKAEKEELELVSKLLKLGLPLDAKDKYGRTGLMYAAKDLKEPLVRILLSHHADKSLKDKSDKTARDYAISARPTINKKDKAGNLFQSALGITEEAIKERQRRSDSIADLLK